MWMARSDFFIIIRSPCHPIYLKVISVFPYIHTYIGTGVRHTQHAQHAHILTSRTHTHLQHTCIKLNWPLNFPSANGGLHWTYIYPQQRSHMFLYKHTFVEAVLKTEEPFFGVLLSEEFSFHFRRSMYERRQCQAHGAIERKVKARAFIANASAWPR